MPLGKKEVRQSTLKNILNASNIATKDQVIEHYYIGLHLNLRNVKSYESIATAIQIIGDYTFNEIKEENRLENLNLRSQKRNKCFCCSMRSWVVKKRLKRRYNCIAYSP